MSKEEMVGLAERLEKRAADHREYVANATIVADLLQPEFAKWESRAQAYNLYAVRTAIDHRNSAKRTPRSLPISKPLPSLSAPMPHQ